MEKEKKSHEHVFVFTSSSNVLFLHLSYNSATVHIDIVSFRNGSLTALFFYSRFFFVVVAVMLISTSRLLFRFGEDVSRIFWPPKLVAVVILIKTGEKPTVLLFTH